MSESDAVPAPEPATPPAAQEASTVLGVPVDVVVKAGAIAVPTTIFGYISWVMFRRYQNTEILRDEDLGETGK